jgi:NTP pyrophosphatase (non-canonical NTP hydrolase)
MDWKKYTEETVRTAPLLENEFFDQLHMAIGISTEAGEILDTFKKSFAYGNNLDIVNVKEELGDCMWYVSNLMRMLDLSLEDVLQLNVDKLRSRYKYGWSKEEANNRDLNKERNILQGTTQLELFDGSMEIEPNLHTEK